MSVPKSSECHGCEVEALWGQSDIVVSTFANVCRTFGGLHLGGEAKCSEELEAAEDLLTTWSPCFCFSAPGESQSEFQRLVTGV